MIPEVPALAAGFASKFDEIGPYIGFGSLVAVVAMAVLVFAQGRELQRLREWAGSSPERLDALEAEFYSAATRAARPVPSPRPGFVAPTAAATGATASVGAPPAPPGSPAAAVAPGASSAPGTPSAPGVPGTPLAPATTAIPGTPAPGVPGSPVVGTGSATPPSVAAGGAPRPTPPRPQGGFGGAPTRVVPPTMALGGPRAATPAGAAAATARERDRDTGGPRRSIGQILGVSVVGVVVLLALLFAFGVIGGDSTGPNEVDPTNGATRTARRATATRYPPTEMKTTVLNASGSSGLAGTVSDRIDQELRFPMGEASNYTVNGAATPEPVTIVQYRAASGQTLTQNRRAAQDLAAFLKKTVPGVRVQRMTDDVAVLAPDQRLVVLVGEDYAARTPQTSTGGAGGTSTDGGAGTTDGATGGVSTTGGAAGAATPDTAGGAAAATTPSTAAPSASDLGDPGVGAVDGGTGGGTTP